MSSIERRLIEFSGPADELDRIQSVIDGVVSLSNVGVRPVELTPNEYDTVLEGVDLGRFTQLYQDPESEDPVRIITEDNFASLGEFLDFTKNVTTRTWFRFRRYSADGFAERLDSEGCKVNIWQLDTSGVIDRYVQPIGLRVDTVDLLLQKDPRHLSDLGQKSYDLIEGIIKLFENGTYNE